MDFRNGGPKIASVIRGKAPATCVSYCQDGSHIFVTSESDSRLRVIDCQRGVSDKPALKFERDGVRLVQSTHHNQSLLYTGSEKDKVQNVGQRHAINYLSLHDNKILRQFRGHSGEVTNISMSPADDSFLTSSKDRTIRLWDLKQAGSLASMDMHRGGKDMTIDPNGCPLAAYDSTGLVFGITAPLEANAGHIIHLYDARQYSSGAFSEMKLDSNTLLNALQTKGRTAQPHIASELSRAKWSSMTFNKSGKQILITTELGLVLVVDGYDANIVTHVFSAEDMSGEGSQSAKPAAACFSSDDQTVLVGNENGSISCFDVVSGLLVKKLDGHVGHVGCVASSPKYAQIASACTNVALWTW